MLSSAKPLQLTHTMQTAHLVFCRTWLWGMELTAGAVSACSQSRGTQRRSALCAGHRRAGSRGAPRPGTAGRPPVVGSDESSAVRGASHLGVGHAEALCDREHLLHTVCVMALQEGQRGRRVELAEQAHVQLAHAGLRQQRLARACRRGLSCGLARALSRLLRPDRCLLQIGCQCIAGSSYPARRMPVQTTACEATAA